MWRSLTFAAFLLTIGYIHANSKSWSQNIILGSPDTLAQELLYFNEAEVDYANLLGFQTQTVTYKGEEPITAIRVLDKWQNGTTGWVQIEKGGLGKTFVTFNFKSHWNQGFGYDIQVYGRSNPLKPSFQSIYFDH